MSYEDIDDFILRKMELRISLSDIGCTKSDTEILNANPFLRNKSKISVNIKKIGNNVGVSFGPKLSFLWRTDFRRHVRRRGVYDAEGTARGTARVFGFSTQHTSNAPLRFTKPVTDHLPW